MAKKILAAGIAVLGLLTSAYVFKPHVIYGDDNRQDLFQVADQGILKAADATVAMIPKNKLSSSVNGMVSIATKIYGHDYNLCKDEAFFEQPTAASCSGFLVGEDLVATAGHCISEVECGDYSFVFGFANNKSTDKAEAVPESEVYNCKEIVAHDLTDSQDYALVRLDRKVTGHQPLKMASVAAAEGDPVLVIGHPAGLPTKVTDGAQVRSQEGDFFVANTDTYGGNSGSAVLNSKTLEVVGILVRGENDFFFDREKSCTRSNYCEVDNCRGEDVTNIFWITKSLPN